MIKDDLYSRLYFTEPTQVIYFDIDFDGYFRGIAIGSKLITFEGDYIDLEYITQTASESNILPEDAIIEVSWKNLE